MELDGPPIELVSVELLFGADGCGFNVEEDEGAAGRPPIIVFNIDVIPFDVEVLEKLLDLKMIRLDRHVF